MKLICVCCGNTDFSGMDITQLLACPVPGCGWQYDPQQPGWVVLRDSSDSAQTWLEGWEVENGDD